MLVALRRCGFQSYLIFVSRLYSFITCLFPFTISHFHYFPLYRFVGRFVKMLADMLGSRSCCRILQGGSGLGFLISILRLVAFVGYGFSFMITYISILLWGVSVLHLELFFLFIGKINVIDKEI